MCTSRRTPRSQVSDDGWDIHISQPERPIHSVGDGFAVGESARSDLRGHGGVHILQMQVGDAIRSLARQLGWIRAANEQMTGVQT